MNNIEKLTKELIYVYQYVFDQEIEVEAIQQDDLVYDVCIKGTDFGISVYNDSEFNAFMWIHSGGFSYENPPETDLVELDKHTNRVDAIRDLIKMISTDLVESALMEAVHLDLS